MRFIGLDLGTKTLGVAVSDLTNIIASSLCIIRFSDSNYNSTYVRNQIKKGKSVRYLLPNEVFEYIEKNKLYI